MSEFDILYKKYTYLENEINKLKNNTAPTIPSYDKTNFPQDAVYGQVVKDINDHSMWLYGEDDTWHQVGTGTLPAYAHGILNTSMTVPAGSTSVFCAFDSAGTFTTDPAIMSWNTITNTNDQLLLHAYGTYIISASAQTSGHDLVIGLLDPSQDQIGHVPVLWSYLANPPIVSGPGLPTTQDYATMYTNGGVRYRFENTDSVDRFIFEGGISVIYLPTG